MFAPVPLLPDRLRPPAVALSLLLAACIPRQHDSAPSEPAPAGQQTPQATIDADLATIALQLTALPADVRCVRALVSGYAMVVRSVDVPAGGSGSVSFPALPLGPSSVYFDAYNVACASVTPNTAPAWVAIEPLKVELVAGQVANLSVDLRRPTSVNTMLDFAEVPAGVFVTPAHTELTAVVNGPTAYAFLKIHNTTGTPFAIPPLTVSGDTDDFVAGGERCLQRPLDPAGVCSIIVELKPKSAGLKRVVVKFGGLYAAIAGAALPERSVRFEPNALDFGGVAVGQQKTLTVTLTNFSGSPYPTAPLGVASSFLTEYRMGKTDCQDVLADGKECKIDVIYTPINLGAAIGDVRAGSLFADLSGFGTGGGALSFNPPSGEFGNVVVGSTATVNFRLTNTTSGPFTVALSISSSDYHFGANNCPGVLPAGAGCDVAVTFEPSPDSFGGGELIAGPGGRRTFLNATVVVPHVTYSPPSRDFGNVPVGTSVLQTFTVTTDTTIPISAFTAPRQFRVTTTGTCGSSLVAGQSCTVEVRFTPSAAGLVTGEMDVGVFLPVANLSGTGVVSGAVTLSPAITDYGTVGVGHSGDLTFMINNTTASDFGPALSFGGNNFAEFQQVGGTCGAVVVANSFCTMLVRFSPTATGVRNATMTAGGSSNTVTLRGTGSIGTPATLSPSTFDFPAVNVGQTLTEAFTLTNNTGGIIAAGASFSPAGDFALATSLDIRNCGGTLANGNSCTLLVRFQPGSGGMKATTMTVGANAVTASLTGTGVAVSTPITNLVVNDTTLGNNGVPNNTEWSVQSNFRGSTTGDTVMAFGDRTYTIKSPVNATLAGKSWIRPAADSKSFTSSATLATFTVTGTTVYILADDRFAPGGRPGWLPAAYTAAGFDVMVDESGAARTYHAWRATVTSGSTVSLPAITGVTSPPPCYLVVVQ
jgi:hypothetical protein